MFFWNRANCDFTVALTGFAVGIVVCCALAIVATKASAHPVTSHREFFIRISRSAKFRAAEYRP
jgi:hypothetical protein